MSQLLLFHPSSPKVHSPYVMEICYPLFVFRTSSFSQYWRMEFHSQVPFLSRWLLHSQVQLSLTLFQRFTSCLIPQLDKSCNCSECSKTSLLDTDCALHWVPEMSRHPAIFNRSPRDTHTHMHTHIHRHM